MLPLGYGPSDRNAPPKPVFATIAIYLRPIKRKREGPSSAPERRYSLLYGALSRKLGIHISKLLTRGSFTSPPSNSSARASGALHVAVA